MPSYQSAYEALVAVRVRVTATRHDHLEAMSKGVEPERYRELVGRAKECAALVEWLSDRIRDLNRGDDDE